MSTFDLHLGDCLEGMSHLAEGSVDLIVTSPPYNLGIAYGKYSDRDARGVTWIGASNGRPPHGAC